MSHEKCSNRVAQAQSDAQALVLACIGLISDAFLRCFRFDNDRFRAVRQVRRLPRCREHG
jgi:hypothetical protein